MKRGEDIEKMVRDAEENAEADKEKKDLIEAKNQAEDLKEKQVEMYLKNKQQLGKEEKHNATRDSDKSSN